MGIKAKLKHIKDNLMHLKAFKDQALYKKYGANIHDIDLNETIKTGITDRLMNAREMGIPYCVVFGNVIPVGTSWDPYGNGDWNPPRDYITTDDIASESNDRNLEEKNIYSFLRGEEITKEKEKGNCK